LFKLISHPPFPVSKNSGLLEKNAHENHPASTQPECHEYLSSNDLQRDFTLRNGVLELKSSPPAI
jgi:hypothetical protein